MATARLQFSSFHSWAALNCGDCKSPESQARNSKRCQRNTAGGHLPGTTELNTRKPSEWQLCVQFLAKKKYMPWMKEKVVSLPQPPSVPVFPNLGQHPWCRKSWCIFQNMQRLIPSVLPQRHFYLLNSSQGIMGNVVSHQTCATSLWLVRPPLIRHILDTFPGNCSDWRELRRQIWLGDFL